MEGLLKTSTYKITFTKFLILFFTISYSSSSNLYSNNTNNKFIINLENSENHQNLGRLYLGSNNQKVDMIFSTGSGLTWVAGKDCANCTKINNNGNVYDAKASNDFKNSSRIINYKVKLKILIFNLINFPY